MKKWIPALVVFLGASVSLAAPMELSCANGLQESLEIVSNADTAVVSAVLASNGVAQSFEGAILPGGRFKMNPTAANESVTLDLVRPRDHGGRCGRCAVDWEPLALNAQLVIGTTAFTFQCQSKEL